MLAALLAIAVVPVWWQVTWYSVTLTSLRPHFHQLTFQLRELLMVRPLCVQDQIAPITLQDDTEESKQGSERLQSKGKQ
jgi:hypothetical protein